MKYPVVNVAAFAGSDEIRAALISAANIRNAALNQLCAMPGYKEMTRTERNAAYDAIVAGIKSSN